MQLNPTDISTTSTIIMFRPQPIKHRIHPASIGHHNYTYILTPVLHCDTNRTKHRQQRTTEMRTPQNACQDNTTTAQICRHRSIPIIDSAFLVGPCSSSSCVVAWRSRAIQPHLNIYPHDLYCYASRIGQNDPTEPTSTASSFRLVSLGTQTPISLIELNCSLRLIYQMRWFRLNGRGCAVPCG